MLAPSLALLASLFWGTADFLGGRASRDRPLVLVLVSTQVAGFVVLAPIALALHGLPATRSLAAGIGAGGAGVIAIAAFYRALALGTMSIVAPIVATSAIVPVAVGVALGDRPRSLQWAGIAVTVIGVVIAARDTGHGPTAQGRRSVGLAVLAAVALGLQLVALGQVGRADALGGVAAARATSAVVLGLVALRAADTAPLRSLVALAGIGIVDTAANVTFAIATSAGLLSVVAVLGSLFPIVTVGLAYAILGERITGSQRVGVALALGGVLALAAS